MTVQLDFVSSLIDSSGVAIGHTMKGFLAFPYGNAMTGLMLQDSAGQYWLLQVDTQGRLNALPVTL